ncbi:sigma-70 family RNA polymerase sigma factor [Sphingomonas sp. BK235]|uniref:RNA polymerase sigma factor n=1 Tax=Sphingomonas sp. BK235 TaxID=2512131 RepID=UPI00104381EE|nr:sigma-70 family RNA polymerase sigma factor [Sphingomonas sp. BK235]
MTDLQSGATPSENLLGISEVERFRSSLHRYFVRRVRDQAEAEDLVQDVFVRLARRGGLGDVANLAGYIFETAASVLQDRARRRQVRAADAHGPFDSNHHAGEDFAPDRVFDGKERLRQVGVALLELPERTRHVFVLRRLEGMRYNDIASQLGISVSSAEKHMQRAIAFLTERMGGS